MKAQRQFVFSWKKGLCQNYHWSEQTFKLDFKTARKYKRSEFILQEMNKRFSCKITTWINLQGWSKGHQWQRRRSSNHNCPEPYWRNQFQHRNLWYAMQGDWRRCSWWYEAYAFVKSNWPKSWRRKWQGESKGDILRGASLLISRIGEIENHDKIIFGWSLLPRSV